jgi:hypothetical protein
MNLLIDRVAKRLSQAAHYSIYALGGHVKFEFPELVPVVLRPELELIDLALCQHQRLSPE